MMKNAIEDHALEDEVVLAGCFCTGNCTREGITIQVDDDVITGVTVQTFDAFFEKNILERLNG
jgi:NADH:ubiquinone oxidoreductase subunit E